jgi:hypothetical protein
VSHWQLFFEHQGVNRLAYAGNHIDICTRCLPDNIKSLLATQANALIIRLEPYERPTALQRLSNQHKPTRIIKKHGWQSTEYDGEGLIEYPDSLFILIRLLVLA